MHMATSTRRWTVDEVRALPTDANRYEVIDGELLVTPAPTYIHQEAVKLLLIRLDAYVLPNRIGVAKMAPADVELTAGILVQPDVFVLPLVSGRKPRTWDETRRLLLAVEVLSAGTARLDRTVKRRVYQQHGVPEYWIADIDAAVIERWRPADDRPEILAEEIVWQPDPAHEPLVIDLRSYFAEVIGE